MIFLSDCLATGEWRDYFGGSRDVWAARRNFKGEIEYFMKGRITARPYLADFVYFSNKEGEKYQIMKQDILIDAEAPILTPCIMKKDDKKGGLESE